uniref:Uncharacterized protein n=1 Tax=viral metagenome TaxID=1070528 RepID=A0A6M3K6A1_9ZZZZ
MKRRTVRNAYGGVSSEFEADKTSLEIRQSDQDRLDTNVGIIVKAYNRYSYDVKLVYNSEVLKYVGVTNAPETPYPLGKQVSLRYGHGNRYQIVVDGIVVITKPEEVGTGDSSSQQDQKSFKTYEMAQAYAFLRETAFVLSEDYASVRGTSYGTTYKNFMYRAKLHPDLSGAELHNTKIHDHSDDNNGGTTLAMTSLNPQSMSDTAALNNTIYFSTNVGKLVYKDALGGVNALY